MGRALLLALLLGACLPGVVGASSGAWDRAWGKGVNGGANPEICTVAANCRIGLGSGSGGAVYPQDVATDANGNVYVVEYADRRVQKFDAQGQFLLAWGKNVDAVNPSTGFEICTVAANCKAGESGTLGGEFDLPSGIGTDAAGNVFVADKNNHRIQEFTSGGTFVRAVGQDVSISKTGNVETCDVASDCKAGTAVTNIGGVLYFPSDVAVGAGGRVYVANGLRRVEVYKPDFTFDRTWGADVISGGGTGFEVCTVDTQCKLGEIGGGRGGEVALVVSVAASAAGDVYVFEGTGFRVERFTADGGFQRAWGKDVDASNAGTGFEICTAADNCKTGVTGTQSGAFRSPNDMVAPASDSVAVDPTGTVYVADRENARVQAFTSNGQFQRTWGTDVDPTNATTGYEICTTTCTGGSEQQVGGSLVKPTGIAAGPTGDVYTADQTGSRIQKFTCAASTVAFASATATIAEDAGTAHLTVQRTGDSGCGASVHYATANGTALAGSDYGNTSGTLTFAVDQVSATIDVPVTPDTEHESDEAFSVTLSNPVSPATIGAPATSTVTITDDDPIDTTITSGPAGATQDRTPTFTFTANPPDDATFECALDQGAFVACDTPYTTASLADGPHRLRVRAINPAHTDTSPATRDFFVDTAGPSVRIDASARTDLGGQQIDATTFAGSVGLRVESSDPEPSGGGGPVGCSVDPPAVPATADAARAGSCAVVLTTPGDHVVYAAGLDAAGNPSAVASTRFRILPQPDTTITGGPSGVTWTTTPTFTFTSNVPGATFRCRVDGGSYVACSSPYTTPALRGVGGHFIQVAAVSPSGAVDPTPARRDFQIRSVETKAFSCVIRGFQADPRRLGKNGCTFEPAGTACSGWYAKCESVVPPCPTGARCTYKVSVAFSDRDENIGWSNWGAVQPRIARPSSNNDPVETASAFAWAACQTRDETPSCDASKTVEVIGDGRAPYFTCSAIGFVAQEPHKSGPDASRVMSCDFTMAIRAAATLVTTTSANTITTYAPGAGTVTAAAGSGSGRSGAAVAAAKKRRPLFKRVKKTVKKAGPVRFKLALSKSARSTFKKKKRLKTSVKLTFKPKTGRIQTKTITVTLRPKPTFKRPKNTIKK